MKHFLNSVESYLVKIDGYFTHRNIHEKWMLIFIINSIILTLFILFLVPRVEIFADNTQQQIIELNHSIQKLKEKHAHFQLQTDQQTKIPRIKKEIQTFKEHYKTLTERLTQQGFLSNSATPHLSVLHTISLYAQNITIENLYHKRYTPQKGVSKRVAITMKAEGTYSDILCFLHNIETHKIPLEIETLQLTHSTSSDILKLTLQIAVWGIS